MRDIDSTAGRFGRTWEYLKQRRWPLWVAALVVVAVAWAIFRGARPATDGAAATSEEKSSPAESAGDSVVALDTTSERLAGIELITVGATKAGALAANGTITYDGNHVSVVASRAEGRVVSVRTDLGQRVRKGDVLVIIESPEVGETRGTFGRQKVALARCARLRSSSSMCRLR